MPTTEPVIRYIVRMTSAHDHVFDYDVALSYAGEIVCMWAR